MYLFIQDFNDDRCKMHKMTSKDMEELTTDFESEIELFIEFKLGINTSNINWMLSENGKVMHI